MRFAARRSRHSHAIRSARTLRSLPHWSALLGSFVEWLRSSLTPHTASSPLGAARTRANSAAVKSSKRCLARVPRSEGSWLSAFERNFGRPHFGPVDCVESTLRAGGCENEDVLLGRAWDHLLRAAERAVGYFAVEWLAVEWLPLRPRTRDRAWPV